MPPPPSPLDGIVAARDAALMRRAVALARRGLGRVAPNPPVGCVLADDHGRIVAEGWHTGPGQPHAEAMALARAGERARGATAYVTLMPCAHRGRTPPCAQALAAAGVRRVVVAYPDPNPTARGAEETLRAAGIPLETGLLAERAAGVMRGYLKAQTTGLPFVTLKYAMTLDGRIATRGGDSQWISGVPARRLVHRWRSFADAVMVGVGTVLVDNPRLNVRSEELCAEDLRMVQAAELEVVPDREMIPHQPLRVVFDTWARTPPTARMFQTQGGPIVLMVGPDAPAARVKALRDAGAKVLIAPVKAWPVERTFLSPTAPPNFAPSPGPDAPATPSDAPPSTAPMRRATDRPGMRLAEHVPPPGAPARRSTDRTRSGAAAPRPPPSADAPMPPTASIDPLAALAMLTQQFGVHTVLCEGGASIAAGLLDAGLVNEVAVFIAPKIMGGREAMSPVGGWGPTGMSGALSVEHCQTWRVPPDFLVVGRVGAWTF